jgi:hypothetical protein
MWNTIYQDHIEFENIVVDLLRISFLNLQDIECRTRAKAVFSEVIERSSLQCLGAHYLTIRNSRHHDQLLNL